MNRIKSLLNKPITKNLSAHSLRILIVFINQILLVPIYITYLGNDLYGDWLVLTAVSQFFTISDFGLNSVTSNAICNMEDTNSNKPIVNSLLMNNYVLILAIALFVLAVFSLFHFFIDYRDLFGLRIVSRDDAFIIIFLLIAQLFLYMGGRVIDSILNATHNAHIATISNNMIMLLNALIIAVCVISGLSLRLISFFYLLPSFFFFFYKIYIAHRHLSFTININNYNFDLFKSMIIPSLSYMCFPICNALLFQGFTIIINSLFPATILILFNTTRTLTNFSRSLIEVVSQGVRPEFGIAYGKKDSSRMNKLYKFTVITCLSVCFISTCFLMVFGGLIYEIWTRGQILFDSILMLCFALTILINTLWNSQSVTMLATNRHQHLGKLYLVGSICSLLLCLVVARLSVNIYLCALCLVVADIPLVGYARKESIKIINLE